MAIESIDISVSFAGLNLHNPLILASGILGVSAQSLQRVKHMGAGALVTKSIGVEPRQGHNNPTVVELEHGIINAMGLPNPGIEAWEDEMAELLPVGIPVICSIFGKDEQEFVFLAEQMESFGANALELNISCPHAKGYGLEIAHDHKLVDEIIRGVRGRTNIPVFVKISAQTERIAELGRVIEEAGASAIISTNTLKAMKIDLDTGIPVLGNAVGGYSGPAIKPVGVRAIYELRKEVQIPVIGVGGINTGEDALEYIMAGAVAVQIGSAVHYRGVAVFSLIQDEMKKWLHAHKYISVSDVTGAAHRGGLK